MTLHILNDLSLLFLLSFGGGFVRVEEDEEDGMSLKNKESINTSVRWYYIHSKPHYIECWIVGV